MTMDEKNKQVEDSLRRDEAEMSHEMEIRMRNFPHDRNEELRRETLARQLGFARPGNCGCVTVMTRDGELVDDYDLCAYCD